MHAQSKKADRLRLLYNQANVLHNLAWEAKHALDEEVFKILVECQTEAEFNKKLGELEELLFCKSWRFPSYPRPRRKHSHSGNVPLLGFHAHYLHQTLIKKAKSKTAPVALPPAT